MSFLLRYLSLALALALVALMTTEIAHRPSPADAAPFHAAAEAAIKAVPMKFGTWEGTEIPIPPSAQALLKPNAILSRQYADHASGEQVSLVLVQCRDTRDMAGHYPPICYPGQGWAQDDPGQVVDRTIRAMRYEFQRHTFDQERTLVVYNFFAVPGQGMPIDMDAIRRAASDYTARPFGAAQVQVALNRRRTPDEEKALVQSVLTPLSPVLDLLSDPKWRRR
jgi:EpsI family protein